MQTMRTVAPRDARCEPERRAAADDVLAEIKALRRDFNEFARAYLNARFPYGKPTDRWSRAR